MTGTDYNAIVADLDKPTATVKPKGNPDRTHIAGLNQTRLKMRTGNGDDAHLWPAKRYVENAIIESDKDRKRFINRLDRIRNRKEKPFGG
jgi:hypothetical protein